MILKQVHADTDVLEFGCAYGRMTRYMAQELKCRVCITEIDAEAFAEASAYAVDGLCGNIETLEFASYFSEKTFDHILFADVLEHLQNPEQVLQAALPLLKTGGSILVSVPNIAHADILAKLYSNRFDYTELGILDNTHVHFWGYHNLVEMFERIGLEIERESGSYLPIYETEQHPDRASVGSGIEESLINKEFSEIYEFFFCLRRKGFAGERTSAWKKRPVSATFYFQVNGAYSEEFKKSIFAETGKDPFYSFTLDDIPENCGTVRFDPAEGRAVAIEGIRGICGEKEIAVVPLNGIRSGSRDIFPVDDPQYEMVLPGGTQSLTVAFRMTTASEKDMRELMLLLNDAKEAERAESRREIGRITAEFETDLAGKNAELENKQTELEAVRTIAGEYRDQHGLAYNYLLHYQNLYRAERAEKVRLEAENAAAAEKMGVLERQLASLQNEVSVLFSSHSWKMTAPARRAMDILKGKYEKKTSGLPGGGVAEALPMQASPAPAPESTLAGILRSIGGEALNADVLYRQERESSGRRILLISHELERTGAPLVLVELAEMLKKQGDLPCMAAPKDGPLRTAIVEKGLPLLIYPDLYRDDIINVMIEGMDLVIVNTIVGGPVVGRLSGRTLPVFWWIHEAEISYHLGALALMPERVHDNIHILCAGSYAENLLKKHRPEYKTGLLPCHWRDVSKTPVPEDFTLGKCLGDPSLISSRIVFVLAATLEERKGQDVLLDAIADLSEEERARCLFLFVGKLFPESRLFAKLKKAESQYSDCIRVLGEMKQEELDQIYRESDYLVCASRDDPGPCVVSEFLSLGKKVISSVHIGHAPILKAYDCGLLYDNDDPAELAGCIRSALSRGRQRDQFFKNARQAFDDNFTEEQCAGSINLYMNQFVQKRNSSRAVERSIEKAIGRRRLPVSDIHSVSVIIPVYNGGEVFRDAVGRLRAQKTDFPTEIIVVDSGSSDGSVEFCREAGIKLIEIPNSEFSHSHARNLGAEAASGDILVFMTQDARPTDEKWLEALTEPIRCEGVAAVSCREEFPEGTDLFYKISAYYHCRYLGISEKDSLKYYVPGMSRNELRGSASLNDVTCAVRADVFRQFKYRFDFGEDLDLGIRLLQSGYLIKLLGSTATLHGHNRESGYYIKRYLIDTISLGRIFMEPVAGTVETPAVRDSILNCYYLLQPVVNAVMCAEGLTWQEYSAGVEAAFDRQIRAMPDGSEPVRLDSKLFEKVIVVLQQEAADIALRKDPELITELKGYFVNVMRPYAEEHGREPSEELGNELAGCLVKQFAAQTGNRLARVAENDPLYEKLDFLRKGV